MAPELVQLVILYLMAVNLAAFFLMGVDKRRAVGKKWRISEKTLFLFSVLGGALGGLLGMRFFHHKTRHWYFRWGFPLLLVVQLLLVVLALRQAAYKERRGHPWVSPPLCSIFDYSFFS